MSNLFHFSDPDSIFQSHIPFVIEVVFQFIKTLLSFADRDSILQNLFQNTDTPRARKHACSIAGKFLELFKTVISTASTAKYQEKHHEIVKTETNLKFAIEKRKKIMEN